MQLPALGLRGNVYDPPAQTRGRALLENSPLNTDDLQHEADGTGNMAGIAVSLYRL